ncbi:MAG: hypothetical protein ACRD1K_20000 [Acidimicrobiales bacterium]
MPPPFSKLTSLLAATTLLVAACSAGGASDDVASLTETGSQSAAASGSGDAPLSEEAALEFAVCMRDNGVDNFPDPTVDADGNVTFGFGRGGTDDNGDPPDFDRDAIQGAREACGDILDGFAFGGGPGGGGFGDNTELQDALVAYTDCLRGEGLDVGDFELPQPGQGGGQGDPPPDGAGPQQGTGPQQGGPGGFVARALGLDTEDPAVAAAMETCQPKLDDAFSNFGPGAGN